MMDAFGTAISLTLQYGVPLQTMVDKFSHSRFDPSGITANREIPFAKSIVDYIFRWLAMEFVQGYRQTNSPQRGAKARPAPAKALAISTASTSDGTNGGNGDSATDGSKARKTEPALSAGAVKATTPMATKLALPLTTPQSDASIAVNISPQLADRYSHLAALQLEHQRFQTDAPICDNCGAITVPNGSCYRCFNCGSSMGCS
jgi:ribonucleoside-diphosphate reductase alpha chain